MNYSHDIPLAELDGLHAKSIDCPCGTDVEEVTPGRSAIVWHQPRTERCKQCGGRGSWVVWGWSNHGPGGEHGRDQRRTCPDCNGSGRHG